MDRRIEQFLAKLPQEKRLITLFYREQILSLHPEISESIKWGNLTFIFQGNLAFIYTYATTAYMNLGFFRGTELNDEQELLEGTGKGMRHIKLYSADDKLVKPILAWIQQSMLLNEKSPK
jgi:hypothetical protein